MAGDEGALAEKAKSGDVDAFAKLVKMFQQRVFGLSCSMIGDYHKAQDIAQETFLRAFKGIKTLNDPGKFGKWLAGIAFKVSQEQVREDKKQPASFHPGVPDSLSFLVKEGANNAMKLKVVEAANSLPADARAILALKYLEGMSYAEIAETMEIEAKTVKSRLFTARKQLREKLGSYRIKK